ncbi:hypothetical protein AM493_10855 [Flavobacterium akiainvivens]|uniref:Uncharacterized protein n=1 Tax=Flavobacterium akiainvivens TaxID=1202724 RepID=A0A0M8MIV4_9FLAO|nr:hypothetical protein [Flavobacterium akiainvivens]KOS06478.1 hypothetical protein AM493_10855 [Flavobacterium akiainvivens]SFQ12601.1 hypothetical protein SAMN05444144_101191 [Flavobacterium akiainvivens]
MKILAFVFFLGFAISGFCQRQVTKTFNLPLYTCTDSIFNQTLNNVLLADTSCLKGDYVFQLSGEFDQGGTYNVHIGWYPITGHTPKCHGYFMVGDRICIIDVYNDNIFVGKHFVKAKTTRQFTYKEWVTDDFVRFKPEEFSIWFFDYGTDGLKLTEHYCVH